MNKSNSRKILLLPGDGIGDREPQTKADKESSLRSAVLANKF